MRNKLVKCTVEFIRLRSLVVIDLRSSSNEFDGTPTYYLLVTTIEISLE